MQSKKPSWIELATVNLRNHVEWTVVKGQDNYDQVYANQLQKQLDAKFEDVESRPQWRVNILRQEGSHELDLVFVWNHPICDGMSGRIFHESLLANLNAPPSCPDHILHDRIISVEGSATTLPPPMEKLCKYSTSAGYLLASAWKEFKPSRMAPKGRRALPNWAPMHKTPFQTKLASVAIDSETTSILVRACRENGTTLTGLFHGIAALSMMTRLTKDQSQAFHAKTAINMRQVTPDVPDLDVKRTMANIVSVLEHELGAKMIAKMRHALVSPPLGSRLEAETALIWSVAKTARQDIQHGLDMGTKDNTVGLMPLVPDWREHALDAEKAKARDTCWQVTNLGVIDGSPAGTAKDNSWSITRARFSVSAQVTGPAFWICPVAVKGKELCVDIIWQANTVDEELAAGFVEDITKWLNYLGTVKNQG